MWGYLYYEQMGKSSSLKLLVRFWNKFTEMYLGWPFSKIIAKFCSIKKHGCGGDGLFALYWQEEILKNSSSLKPLIRFWNNFTEMSLFKKSFVKFWSVGKQQPIIDTCMFCLIFLATIGHVLMYKRWSLGDLSQNLFAEFLFIKNMDVVMILVVVMDFEKIFIGDFFNTAWQNTYFVSKVSILKKKIILVLSKIQKSNSGPFWPSHFLDSNGCKLTSVYKEIYPIRSSMVNWSSPCNLDLWPTWVKISKVLQIIKEKMNYWAKLFWNPSKI